MKNTPVKKSIREEYLTDTVDEFLLDKQVEGCSQATLRTYNVHLKRFVRYMESVNEKPFTKMISKRVWNGFIKDLQGSNVRDATVNSYCITLRCFLNDCFRKGYVKKFEFVIPKFQTKVKQVYTDEELVKLLKKPDTKTCSFTEYKTWMLENIAIATGLRISSILSIKIGDISFEECSIDINVTKNKKAFKAYFSRELGKLLREYLYYREGNPDDFLICTDMGNPIALRTAQDHIRSYNLKRGVYKTSCHLFRHTFAKNSILAGVDVFTLMKRLQHSNIETTLNYVRMLDLDVKNAVDLYNPQKLYKVHCEKIKMRK